MERQIKLQAHDLHVLRGGKKVLAGVSFEVAGGEVYGLLGGNGAGKSTTLSTFLGFLPVATGRVVVNGRDVGADVVRTRREIAYLPETAAMYDHLNARENLRYFLQLAEINSSESDIDHALDRVSLDGEARQQLMRGYSKGMRQKVAIALAVLRDTDILLLDEPTSGLDPTAIDEFHHLVRSLANSGKAILMVTHDVYGVCQVADRIGLLSGGKLVDEFAAPAGGRIQTETVHRAFSNRESS